jgi:hypothetical protein
LYAFSWYNSKCTVSLLDSDGNSYWQYSTPGGNSFNSKIIKYKEIDAENDMIIATSGADFTNYNRIISSSTLPYPYDV